MFKALAALAASFMLASATPAPNDYPHDESAIVKVLCAKAYGTTSGSAFKVGRDSYITAAHVVEGGQCSVNGSPITVTSMDSARDYATFIGPASDAIMPATCSGFKGGRVYIARGYPGGMNYNIYAPWIAVAPMHGGFAMFVGDGIPGMSGGPLIDERGFAVGVVNRRMPTRSMPLKSTSYCRGS